jgi:hypothetical protein
MILLEHGTDVIVLGLELMRASKELSDRVCQQLYH